MVSARDVNQQSLVEAAAENLKSRLAVPEWTSNVKTGSHVERQPDDGDWWYFRSASLMRKIYMDGPVGIQKLRTYYGGLKNRGHKPSKFRKAGGKNIRSALQDLEKAGYVRIDGKKGRVVTPQGQKFLDGIAKSLKK